MGEQASIIGQKHKGIDIRGKGIRIAYKQHGQWRRKTLDLPQNISGLNNAISIREGYMRENKAWELRQSGGYRGLGELIDQDMLAHYKIMFQSARKRAKGRGEEYKLTEDDERCLMLSSTGSCPMTGVKFTLERNGGHKAPYAPSLDRIDRSNGYAMGNVRIICVAANYAMNEWGEDVFALVARGYTKINDADSEGFADMVAENDSPTL